MIALFEWFTPTPFLFYLIALIALFVFLYLAVLPASADIPGRRSRWPFLLATAVVMFAWRWPTFLYPHHLDPDEGLWAAGALKTLVDPVPWRGFDGTTSGPLCSYLLALPALFGGRVDFFSMRVIGTSLLVLTIFGLYYSIKWIHGDRVARLAIIPMVAMLALTNDRDFIAFTSECLPVFLTTTALAAAIYLVKGNGSDAGRIIAGASAGLLTGATGFAKLQALPIAGVVFLFALTGIILSWRGRLGNARRVLAVTLAGLFSVPVVIVVSLWVTGTMSDAITSYLGMSVAYVAHGRAGIAWPYFFGFVRSLARSYSAFLIPTLFMILILTSTLLSVKRSHWRLSFAVVYPVVLLFTSYFAIYEAHRAFPHYLLFGAVPVSCCLGAALGLSREASLWQKREALISASVVALAVLPQLSGVIAWTSPFVSHIIPNWNWHQDAVTKAISRYAKPGTKVAIWGWMPDYYVETQTIMATRDAQTLQQILPQPYDDYFRARYISDLNAHKPPVFVDAVAPGSFRAHDRATEGFETFPALAAFIHANYVLREDVEGVRIFTVKASRAISAGHPPGSRAEGAELTENVSPLKVTQLPPIQPKPLSLRGIKPLYQVSIAPYDHQLLIHALGADPQLLLPKAKTTPATTYALHIEIEAPANTQIQLFYQTRHSRSFVAQRMVDGSLRKGTNDILLIIPSVDFNGIMRLDPGSVKGDYLLRALNLTVRNNL